MTQNHSLSLLSQAPFSTQTFNRKLFIALKAGIQALDDNASTHSALKLVLAIEDSGQDFSLLDSHQALDFLTKTASQSQEFSHGLSAASKEFEVAHGATLACKSLFDFLDDAYFDQPAKDIFLARECIRDPRIVIEESPRAALAVAVPQSKSKKT